MQQEAQLSLVRADRIRECLKTIQMIFVSRKRAYATLY